MAPVGREGTLVGRPVDAQRQVGRGAVSHLDDGQPPAAPRSSAHQRPGTVGADVEQHLQRVVRRDELSMTGRGLH